MDAFESIMERLIEQKEQELEDLRTDYITARRSVSQFAAIEEAMALPFMLRGEGHLEGLRVALAKYREEGGCPEDSDPGGWNAELLREARERERDSGWEQMGR